MDAIRLHKCGFKETVASLGTSLTQEQAEMLARFADRCYICYDADKPGQNATLRSMFVLQKHGLDVYVVSLPAGKDPDEFLLANPASAFEEALRNARPLIARYLEAFSPSLADPLTKKSALRELFGGLLELEVHEVLQYKMHISEATGIPPSKIEEWFLSKQKREIPDEAPAPLEAKGVEPPSEAALCSLLYHHQECRLSFSPEEALKFLRNPEARQTAYALLTEDPDAQVMIWSSIGETTKLGLLARGDEVCARMKGLTLPEKWQSIYGALLERDKNRRIRELTGKLKQSQATPEELAELARLKNAG